MDTTILSAAEALGADFLRAMLETEAEHREASATCFYFLDAHALRKCTLPRLGRLQDLKRTHPDWIVERMVREHGGDDGLAALEAMNVPQSPVTRPDGDRQGRASQWVAEEVPTSGWDRVVDLCAAPGGKSTAMAGRVVALDLGAARVRALRSTVARTGNEGRVAVVRADGRHPPVRPSSADAVLVDAPCSGLGALGRRPDARWNRRPGPLRSARRSGPSLPALVAGGGGRWRHDPGKCAALPGRGGRAERRDRLRP